MRDPTLNLGIPPPDVTGLRPPRPRRLPDIMRQARRARASGHVDGLSDHLLDDIGLTRDAVERGAGCPVWNLLSRSRQAG